MQCTLVGTLKRRLTSRAREVGPGVAAGDSLWRVLSEEGVKGCVKGSVPDVHGFAGEQERGSSGEEVDVAMQLCGRGHCQAFFLQRLSKIGILLQAPSLMWL